MAHDTDQFVRREIAQAQAAFRAGQLKDAAARVDKLYRRHSRRPEVLMARGMVLGATGRSSEALEMFDAALALRPEDLECLAWAAFYSLNERKFGVAESLALRMTEAAPQNARGYFLLANALRGLDRTQEALDAIDRALVLSPHDPESWVTKARLLKDWQLSHLAIDAYLKAMSIRPTAAAANDLARIFLQENHPEDALELLKDVEGQFSPSERPNVLLAEALSFLGRFEDAETRWSMAEKQPFDRAWLTKTRARVAVEAGRGDLAVARLAELLEDDRHAAEAFAILARAKRIGADERPLLERMERLLQAPGMSRLARAELHTALGKSYDDLKEFDRAIVHFDAANSLCLDIYPERRNFDLGRLRSFTDFLISEFTSERLAGDLDSGLGSATPLFITGMRCSGIGLVESGLSRHPSVRKGGEQSFWVQRMVSYFIPEEAGFRFDRSKALQYAADYLRLVDRNYGVRFITDSNAGNFDLAGVIHSVLPQSKIVHVERHPVDNLLARWMSPLGGEGAYGSVRSNMVAAYREHRRLLGHWQSILRPEGFMSIRYEDVVGSPVGEEADLLRFLALEPGSEAAPAEELGGIDRLELSKDYEPWLAEFGEGLDPT